MHLILVLVTELCGLNLSFFAIVAYIEKKKTKRKILCCVTIHKIPQKQLWFL